MGKDDAIKRQKRHHCIGADTQGLPGTHGLSQSGLFSQQPGFLQASRIQQTSHSQQPAAEYLLGTSNVVLEYLQEQRQPGFISPSAGQQQRSIFPKASPDPQKLSLRFPKFGPVTTRTPSPQPQHGLASESQMPLGGGGAFKNSIFSPGGVPQEPLRGPLGMQLSGYGPPGILPSSQAQNSGFQPGPGGQSWQAQVRPMRLPCLNDPAPITNKFY